ncbi:MAG: GNAT family N-acetyltransferase [Prevotella sp.]|nr:GNAT family N-acetyltransferase [Prevotella sp.]
MDGIRITTYAPQYRDDFIRLNKEWIETYFRLEESDLKTFANIDSYIIGNGGQIFLAIADDGQVVGCCALISHPDRGWHELAKMAVSPHWQGHHIGHRLGEALISYACEHGVRHIFLEGNTRLEASIALYRKLGFQEVPLDDKAYDRCDILMQLEL